VLDRRGDLVEQRVDLVLAVAPLSERWLAELNGADIVSREVAATLKPVDHQLQEVVDRFLVIAALAPRRLLKRCAPNILGRQATVAHGV
jgi:hypothetical protein